ncbi:MAG: glutaredoxin-related protein [Bilifractor sp.]
MIKIYGMPSCPDCSYVEKQVEGNTDFEVIDIGSDVRKLKEFTRIRDKNQVFNDARENGYIGIPCLVLEDGTVTLTPEDAGLKSRPHDGAACRLDGSGC